ncbi:MAG TPA: S-layer homology domain-containing protein [Thermoanaerobaculia bacterium]|jgi:streptogramin lyase|nr:S-layer homology domain-containing protein [Thermoanaerobaculia bacterium]
MNLSGFARFVAVCFLGAGGIAVGQVITEFPIPTTGSQSFYIATGPDGNLWFAEVSGNKIARITTAGVVTEFPIPTPGADAFGIAAGPDGNLWFTEGGGGGKIGRITPTGTITEFPIPSGSGALYGGLATGPDGNLWFTEQVANKIGRITTAGTITEFPIPTPLSGLYGGLAAGPDGNLWFTEVFAYQIGRITPTGVITEFPVPSAASQPSYIAVGPDGNLWFTEFDMNFGNKIGRITTTGVITEFPTPTAGSQPSAIAPGLDGNLWFTEVVANQIGRINTLGVVTGEFSVPTFSCAPQGIVAGPDGNLWFVEEYGNKIGRITPAAATPQPLAVDANMVTGSISNLNGVFEPGETVQVAPRWMNTLTTAQSFGGTASNLTGPAGPTYTIEGSAADYGAVAGGATADCNTSPGGCYLMSVSGTRPVQHWDATFTEDLSVSSVTKTWKVHIGESFPDVPTSNPFYSFVENLFHNGITGGCAGGNFCPTNAVTRSQIAVLLMKSKLGATRTPPPATGTVFADVPASDSFAPWIEQLAGFAITGGCGGGNYCPDSPVTRAQMAVFLLKAEHGSSYLPPSCTGIFSDVECTPTPAFAVDWIEQLHNEGVTGGCGTGLYCPSNPVNRGQIAVFLTKTFGLKLYGP